MDNRSHCVNQCVLVGNTQAKAKENACRWLRVERTSAAMNNTCLLLLLQRSLRLPTQRPVGECQRSPVNGAQE